MALQNGQKAPDFTLFNSDKKEVTLDSYAGRKLVVLFFPLAFSSVCTAELCEMRDNISTYGSLDADVVAISVDSPYTLARFKDDQHLPFQLLSDFNKDVSTAYGALHETFSYNMRGVSKRAAFVIDREGVIRYVEVLENPGKIPNFQAVQDALQSIK
ncbi:alkyl hydroperoxide reductase/ Thiol specific antioxidant/ Mal allergen [Fibrisoma limi BUZ 3]|uniref:Alkyl hydroperoxide reductase/ Thiol specific antioxidant/ Mal allergen n=1 Tax=Fibrisoma limi BUZ 3 TaxID=1185876 RepID=I2GLY4_9BACT|nr:redoxin domain-containing protein [Fibrisoma limi]CCH54910.1 alkyl hydroperoxide reductase/ Thiol specific antioxidant/ Mal allergen [Fibrisoma limi BUZ 3]